MPVSVISAFSPRIFIPWLVFVIVVAACVGIIIRERVRNTGRPLDCIMGSWSEWTGCDDCTSMGVRTRNVEQQAETGGIPCKAFSRAETQLCATLLNCDDSSCQYTPWTPWTECPATCFRGLASCSELPSQFRMRSIARPAFEGGTPCDWATLIEQHPCLPTAACEVDQSCVAASDSPEDCTPCPGVGCTVTDPFWTYCTRSILLSKTGAGEACTSEQLIYSHTCPLPDCTADCQAAYNNGQFSTCSKPCGTGWLISAVSCPDITTEPCNTQACPIGTMVLSETTCTFLTSRSCDTLSECLALCASDPTCNVVQPGFRGSATCLAGSLETWVWEPTATTCVPPTWEMVNATCLYVCDQEPSYSTQRGIVFHFNDSNSLSCPINPSLLSSSQACPITTTPVASLIAALWAGPSGVSQLVSNTDPYIPLVFTTSCPSSSDCQYQSWSQAPVWQKCGLGCANGGGIRQRQRAITAPAYFLGVPCDVTEQNEYAACNQHTQVTSATDMGCSGGTDTMIVSDIICHQAWQDNSQSAMQLSTLSHTIGNEILLYSKSAPLNSITIGSYVPPSGFVIATQQQVADAYEVGFQACAPGWFATPPLQGTLSYDSEVASTVICPPYELGSSFSTHPWSLFSLSIVGDTCKYVSPIGLPSFSFLGSTTCPWGYTYSSPTCTATINAACLPGQYFTSRDGGGCALPLESEMVAAPKYAVARVNHQSTSACPYPNGILTSDTAYVFLIGDKTVLPTALPFFMPYGPSSLSAVLTSQTYHDERACSFFPSRTDALLNQHACAGAMSVMYDKPCGAARDCSYTAWVDVTNCGACIPPATKIQTRSIARQPSEGGQDCTQPLSTATDCFGPPCASNANACSYEPFPSLDTCSSAYFPPTIAYLSEWSPAQINAYADYGISSLFPQLSSMSNGASLTNDIAWALNAQCTPALCLPSVSAIGIFTGQSWAMNEDLGVAAGWETSTCEVSVDTLRCLGDRLASYPTQNESLTGSFVYNLEFNTWNPISMCPYELACCSWSDCSECAVNGSRTQTVTAPVNGGASCGIVRTLVRNCEFLETVPTCANSLTCPVTTDGTPCNSQSGYGECVLSITTPPTPPFYYCSCTAGHVGRACNNGCPVGSNALTCSGNGDCDPRSEQCACNAGWFGPRCDQRGPASFGLLEMLLYQTRMDFDVHNDTMFRVSEVNVTNSLGCDVESNAVCAGAQFDGNSDNNNVLFNPYAILDLDFTSDYPHYANICVNETDAGATWVPSALLLATGSELHPCQNLTSSMDVSARFTSHSAVPTWLHGRSFYTSCNVLTSPPYAIATGSLTQHIPCQYAEQKDCTEGAPDQALFLLNGYEGTLDKFCTFQAKTGATLRTPAVCDVGTAVDGFPGIHLSCTRGACAYTYPTNPNLPLVVKSAIVGTTITYPVVLPGAVNCMGLLINCNAFPVTVSYTTGVSTVSSGHVLLASYGTFATTLTIT